MNFTDTVPKVVEKEKPDMIVLQTGSIEISNINVKRALMDENKDIEDYRKEWCSKVENDSANLFKVAEDAIKKNPNMKVIIVKRLPRHDSPSVDPLGIKRKLSNFANNAYDQCWFKRGAPKNIHIVNFDLGCENSPYLKDIIFGNPGGKHYDGVHLRGFSAARHFTYRAVQAIKPVVICRTAQNLRDNRSDSHNNCPQAQYQRQLRSDSRQVNTEQFVFPRRFKKANNSEKKELESHKYGPNYYSIPVQNRYPENY